MQSSFHSRLQRAATYLIAFFFLFILVLSSMSYFGIVFPYLHHINQILIGGFIGGVTNKVAIKMLFEKKWFLPGSGVLLNKQKEIIHSLADTVESHLINTEMLQNELRKVLKPLNIRKAKELLNSVIDEFRDDMREHIKSEGLRREILETLKTRLGFLGRFLNVTRLKEYEEMADAIITELDAQLLKFRITDSMVAKAIQRVGSLEDFLFKPDNEVIRKHYASDKAPVQLLFEKVHIREMVFEKLSSYEPTEVRDIIESNIRNHLLWLEVFGVFLGMLFAGAVVFIFGSFTQ